MAAMPMSSAPALPVPEAAAPATMATPKKPRRNKTSEPGTSTKLEAPGNVLMLLQAAAEKAKSEQPAKSILTMLGAAGSKPPPTTPPPHSGMDSANSTPQSASKTTEHPNTGDGLVKKTQQSNMCAAEATATDTSKKRKATQTVATKADQAKLSAVELAAKTPKEMESRRAAEGTATDTSKKRTSRHFATKADQAKLSVAELVAKTLKASLKEMESSVETCSAEDTATDASKKRTSRKTVAAHADQAQSSVAELVAKPPKETESSVETCAEVTATDTSKKRTSRKTGATKADQAKLSMTELVANTPKEAESSVETAELKRRRLQGKQATSSATLVLQASVQISVIEPSAGAGSGQAPTISKGHKKMPAPKSQLGLGLGNAKTGSGQQSDKPAKAACTNLIGETFESGNGQQSDTLAKAVPTDNLLNEPFDLVVGSFNVPCCCTRDPDVVDAWARDVSRAFEKTSGSTVGVLGFDCEWAAPWHRAIGSPDKVATLQLCFLSEAGQARALVAQVVGLTSLPPALAALLADERIAKVGAGVAGDASRVSRDFGGAVRGLYDLSSMISGKRVGRSLEAMVRAYCPDDMHIQKASKAGEKGVRTSNWETWPLSAEQVRYAAADAVLSVLAFAYRFDMVSDKSCSGALSQAALKALSDGLTSSEDPAPGSEKATDTSETALAGSKVSRKRSATMASEETGHGEDKKKVAKSGSGLSDEQKANFFQAMRNKGLTQPNLGKKEHPQGRPDALKEVCIIVSGILDSFERKDMEKYVTDHGGSVAKAVTKKVTHLVTDHGEAGPSKMKKCKELGIPVVSEDVILQMVHDSLAGPGA